MDALASIDHIPVITALLMMAVTLPVSRRWHDAGRVPTTHPCVAERDVPTAADRRPVVSGQPEPIGDVNRCERAGHRSRRSAGATLPTRPSGRCRHRHQRLVSGDDLGL